MADTLTVNLKLRLPRLGKKPWKSDWDFNFTKIDQLLGGLVIDGSTCAVCAQTIHSTALDPYIISITGDLGSVTIPAGETREYRVNHSSLATFRLPSDPIFTAPTNVNVVILAERNALTAFEYGAVFHVRIENRSDTDVSGTLLTWMRRGIVITP